MAAVENTLRIKDADTLRSAYEAYVKTLINRRMVVPAKLVAETVDIARDEGMKIQRKPSETFDHSFVERLDKIGFMKELWGGALEERGQ